MGELDVALPDRVRIDGEVVIVRGDLDFAAIEAFHRMIAAMMSELELVSSAAEREADKLMSEADAEYGSLAHEAANIVPRVIHGLRVTGAVRQKGAVRTG